MNKGLSNFQIDDFFENEENEDLKKYYMGTYSIDSITKYTNFYEIMKRGNSKYLYAIFNAERENEPGVHWWSFIDINPKNNLFLFDSFGLEGFKLFIVNNNQDIINELLYNFKKCEGKPIQKLKLCTIKFCVETLQKMSKKKRPINRNRSKIFPFIRTVRKIEKDSLHEYFNIRKSNSRFN